MKTYNKTSIKHLRLAMKKTQASFARMVGLSWQQIYYLELGKSKPDIETLAKIAGACGLQIDYFFDDANTTPHNHETQHGGPRATE